MMARDPAEVFSSRGKPGRKPTVRVGAQSRQDVLRARDSIAVMSNLDECE